MRKSAQERAEIRRLTEANRRADKDRSQHLNARSKGKKTLPTLADLSRQKPTEEELRQVFSELETDSDRGCALIAASWLENTLEMAVDCHLADCGKVFWNKMHVGGDAPLGTFSAKIKMGRALGIYDAKVQKAFETVKDIRNAFAHGLRPLDFQNPTVVAACRSLDKQQMPKQAGSLAPARIRYISFCIAMSHRLYDVATKQGGKEIPVSLTIADPPPPAKK